MNDTGCVPLVDTDRDELRDRIGEMTQRFHRLARSADPHARVPGLDWTVQQVVAHMLSAAHRYRAVDEGRDFHRASHPRELDKINRDELDAVMAPIPDLVDELEALSPLMDAQFDSLADDYSFEFHCGVMASGIMSQTNWLGELVLHGDDIARAVGVPWEIPERDMLLVLRGVFEVCPAYVRADLPARTDVCVALRIPEARPYVMHVHDSTADIRELRPTDRPDAVMRTPAATLGQLLYGRIGPMTAARKRLLIVGGRRPWKAMKLQSCFERP
jgi:uncharacterized protein (TIGR03083 family)